MREISVKCGRAGDLKAKMRKSHGISDHVMIRQDE